MSGKRRGSRLLVPGEARGRGGLVLPGAVPPNGARTLLVPRGYETGAEQVIVGKCHVCDATFYRGEENDWQRHVGRCAREHLPEILAEREAKKQRLAVFQEENWDPEASEHLRKVGKRMLAEGRLVLRKNERLNG